MRPELFAKLLDGLKSANRYVTGVTGVTHVTGAADAERYKSCYASCYGSNVQETPVVTALRVLRVESDCLGKMPPKADAGGATSPVTEGPQGVTGPDADEPDACALEERAALASTVPEVYRAAWARFQLVRPRWADPGVWERAVNDAGLFLDRWGDTAAEMGWSADDIFGRDGLALALGGDEVRALGTRHAMTEDGRTIRVQVKQRAEKADRRI